ncbi:MAG: 50S ribosomal protein L25/general stress protein Ctc [Gammaproteobacteria bacterium]|nr:MAG: 50S ribosomal protein L25/general stress protein Ctc [Gammaproteobacteria bacterium]
MTDSNVINAEIREDVGKGASRRLRQQGKIPAVIYGGKIDPATLTLEHGPLMHAAANESFYSSILDIRVADGRTQKVVVRDVHHHPYKLQIMHLDFMRVSAEEILKISVPIHYTNEEESPAGKASGVIIQHLVTEVEIAALPENLPEYLEVDLTELDDGDVVMLSDIRLPEGVEISALSGDDEDEIMIANTVHIKESQGTGVAAAEDAAAAEAELIAAGEIVAGEEPEEGEEGEAEAEGESEGEDEDSEGDKE